uniref:ATP phosphoribosyltransferase n=1 Tax=Syphacia muris TaxID=451379 RepID=A0A0N5ASJ2_9BILA
MLPMQTVGLGVAMVMQQAGALVGAKPQVDVVALEGKVRKAKAEGRTVTMVNGCLYFDYQLVAYLPPYIDFHI